MLISQSTIKKLCLKFLLIYIFLRLHYLKKNTCFLVYFKKIILIKFNIEMKRGLNYLYILYLLTKFLYLSEFYKKIK